MTNTPAYFIHNSALKANDWKMFTPGHDHIDALPPDEPGWMISPHQLARIAGDRVRVNKVGLVFSTDYAIEDLGVTLQSLNDLQLIEFIGIDFPVYTDGRGFSLAWSLRQEFGWEGELRALGDVLIDTVNYLSRCGFNSFVLKEGHDPLAALRALMLFDSPYQNTK